MLCLLKDMATNDHWAGKAKYQPHEAHRSLYSESTSLQATSETDMRPYRDQERIQYHEAGRRA